MASTHNSTLKQYTAVNTKWSLGLRIQHYCKYYYGYLSRTGQTKSLEISKLLKLACEYFLKGMNSFRYINSFPGS